MAQKPALFRNNTTQFTKAAAPDSGEGGLFPGCGCLALYEEDGKFYDAVIKTDLGNGYMKITYTGYGLDRDLHSTQIKSKAPTADPVSPRSSGPSGVSVPPRPTVRRNTEENQVATPRPHVQQARRASVGITPSSPSATAPMSAPLSRREVPATTGISAKALYNFKADKPGDLALRKGDIITDVDQKGKGWWRGYCNGQYGRYPANYVSLCSPTQSQSPSPAVTQFNSTSSLPPRNSAPASTPKAAPQPAPKPIPTVVASPPSNDFMSASAPVKTRTAAVPRVNLPTPAPPRTTPPASPRNVAPASPQPPRGAPPTNTTLQRQPPTPAGPPPVSPRPVSPRVTTPAPPTTSRPPQPKAPAVAQKPPSPPVSIRPTAAAPTPAARAQPPAPAPAPKAAGPQYKVGDAVEAIWSEDGQWYAAVIDHAYDEGGVNYFDVTFTEYGNTEAYLTIDKMKKAAGQAVEPEESGGGGGSLAAALAAKKNKLAATKPEPAKAQGPEPIARYEPGPSKSGGLESQLASTKVTQRALNMSIYMPQDKLQGVDDDEWNDDDDSCFDF